MITTRELPAAEWDRLTGHPVLGGLTVPDARFHRVVVAEDGGAIVGVWFLLQVVHLEPIWIADTHRGGLVAGRLWHYMRRLLDWYGIARAYCFSDTPEVASYLDRLGFRRLDYDTFQYEVASCPSQSSPQASEPLEPSAAQP